MAEQKTVDEKKPASEPKAKAKPKVANLQAAPELFMAGHILSVSPDIPQAFADDMSAEIYKTYKTVKEILADKPPQAIYRINSVVRGVSRNHMLKFYNTGIAGTVVPVTSGLTVFGIDMEALYPNVKESFVDRLTDSCEAQGIENIRDVAHRSAPPKLEIAFQDALRNADDIGLDGHSIYDKLVK